MGSVRTDKQTMTAGAPVTAGATTAGSSGFSLEGFLAMIGLGSEPAAAVNPLVPRIVSGGGHFVYQQDPDGTITVLSGPKRIGEVHPPGDPVNEAITLEIGPYRSPLPTAPAAGAPAAGAPAPIAAPVADERDPPLEAGDDGFKDGTQTVPGSTLDVAKSRVGMDTKYKLDGLTPEQIAAMNSGAADASTFFCSGLSVWTLAAAGYDVAEPIKGADGVPYSYTDKNAKTQPGTPITMRMVLNGEGAAVTALAQAKSQNMTNGGWVMFVDNDRAGFETGITADGADAAVKGAVGAFELAHIGAEVAEVTQKPGDFAQSRYTNAKEIKGVVQAEQTVQQGAGHAWQVWSVTAKGSAMFGLARSPKPKTGTLTGWHDGVEFTIDKDTDPTLVGEHEVAAASRIEANIAGARSGSQKQSDANGKGDTGGDGGVGISKDMAVPDADGPSHYYNYVVFYGRLTDNPWTGWKPAKAP